MGWGVLLAVAAGVSVANVYYAQPLLDRIGADLAVRPGALGLVTTVTQAGYLLGLVRIVPLGDLLSRRRMIVWQGASGLCRTRRSGARRDAVVFFAACAVVGLASVVVQVIVAYAAALSIPGQRGSAVGMVTSGVVTGILMARTASGLIADRLGWRAVYFLSAALMLAMAVMLGRRPSQGQAMTSPGRRYGLPWRGAEVARAAEAAGITAPRRSSFGRRRGFCVRP